jgi:uncharacterized protein (DUF1800 family)
MNTTTTVQTSQRRPTVLSGLTPYAGTFGRNELTHLLKRTMFGAKKADIDFFQGKTLVQVVNALLTAPATEPAPPINNYDNPNATPAVVDTDAPFGTTWVWTKVNGNYDGLRRNSLRSWWLGNMVNQDRTIFEKMLLFWHNHFATENVDTNPILGYHHVALLRKYTLGNFKDMVRDITFDPQMLRYLNGYVNTKTAPDENYARELQELFTLGKGPDSQYTEGDVKAAAKILTGWRYNELRTPVDGKYGFMTTFTPSAHDTSTKTFSAFYGGATISGATANTEADARKEVDSLLNMIFAKDEVAKYMCRRLYRFFVYYEIDAATEANVIVPLADIFRQNAYNIKPVLKALFTSEHFFDVANKGCFIKSPLEYVVGIAREFNMDFPTATDFVQQYASWAILTNERYGASAQGQNVGNPPNVAGWPAYYQEPVYHEYWINTDAFPKRIRFAEQFLTNTGVGVGNNKRLLINVLAFTDQFGNDASDPNKLIDRVIELLYRVPVTTKFKNYAKNILLSGQSSDYYWTDAWDAYKTNPTTANTNIVNTRLQTFYKLFVNQPEFHLI